MHLKAPLVALLATVSGAAQAQEAAAPKRPSILPGPYQPYRPIPLDTPRDGRVCRVKPSCTPGRDDSAKIVRAMEECNDGGTVLLDGDYTICRPLDLRFLKHIDVALTGNIEFCTDIEMWQQNLFRFHFQGASSWWVWGGEDVNLYGLGEGAIHGNGQEWWDAFAANGSITRPVLFLSDGWHGGSITGLKLRESPMVSLPRSARVCNCSSSH